MTQAITDKKPPYLLMMFVTIIYLVVTAFFEEGVAYFDPVYTTIMSSTEFYLTFFLSLFLSVPVFYLSVKFFHIKFDVRFFSFLFIFLIIDAIGIFSFPAHSETFGSYSLTTALRFRYFFFWVAACVAIYIMFVIMPKSVFSINQWSPYFWLGTMIAISATIYSFIKESSLYANILTSGTISSQIVSYTNNKNTYGTLLLVGVICSCFYAVFSNKKWFFLISLYFWLNSVLVASKSAFFCATFFLVAFIIWKIVKNIKGHPIKSSFSIFGFSAFMVLALLLLIFGPNSNVAFLKNLSIYLVDSFGVGSTSLVSSLATRFSIWQRLLTLLGSSPTFLSFGLGDWNLSWFLGFFLYSGETVIGSAHSGFADVIGRFGILGLILYLGLISWFFVKIIDSYRMRKQGTSILLFAFMAVLVHGLFEDTNFMNVQAKDMMFIFLTFVMVLTQSSAVESGWEIQYSMSNRFDFGEHRIFSNNILTGAICFLLIVGSSVLIGMAPFFAKWLGNETVDTWAFKSEAISIFLFFPSSLYLAFLRRNDNRKTGFEIWVSSLCILFIFSLICCIVSKNTILAILIVTLWVLAFVISVVFSSKPINKKVWILFASYLLISSLLIIINNSVIALRLIPETIYQPYAILCLLIFDSAFTFSCLFVSPLCKKLFPSIQYVMEYAEDLYRFYELSRMVKFEVGIVEGSKKSLIVS